jgi:hypothetical protein
MTITNAPVKNSYGKWIIAEKVAGLILLAWSVFVLYSIFSMISGVFNSNFMATGKVTYGSLAEKNHLIIFVGILSLFGSCMLLYKDKTGWLLCVVTSFVYGISLFISSRSNAVNTSLPFTKYYKSYGASALVFLLIFVLLLLPPIRKKYQPSLKTWIIIVAIIALIILDKMIFKL